MHGRSILNQRSLIINKVGSDYGRKELAWITIKKLSTYI